MAAPHVQRVVIPRLCAGPRIGPSELFRLEWRDVDLATAMLRMPGAQKNHLEKGAGHISKNAPGARGLTGNALPGAENTGTRSGHGYPLA